ncbi:MAG TPA: RagB/SusD family nutrient uptake outer membrane protein, partial [Anseongella sp.]|nr:RagB/SusD family nutrient uptake outer membrane protein [Anseongella sp.]
MKKHICNLLAAAVLAFSGCSEDLLDKNPRDQISSDAFWKSKSDLDMALTACYGSLQNAMFSYETPNWDVLTDNAYGQHNYGGSQAIVQGDISPSSGGYISDVYSNSYRAITRLNIFLTQLAGYTGSDLDAALRSAYEAEARFLRGYYYYLLYFCYGAVPLVTEPLLLENQVQPKVPAEQVLQQSVSDLDFAISNLQDVPYSENGGHAVRASAEALKARLLLYAAYDES